MIPAIDKEAVANRNLAKRHTKKPAAKRVIRNKAGRKPATAPKRVIKKKANKKPAPKKRMMWSRSYRWLSAVTAKRNAKAATQKAAPKPARKVATKAAKKS